MTFSNLISVIVPAYNAGPFLQEALQCILQQDYQPLEIIVIDDGSTDGACNVEATFSDAVTCVRQHNQGAGAARNRGLRLARGSFIAFLDVDDLWPSGTLARLAHYLSQNPRTEIAMGRVQYMRRAAPMSGSWTFENFSDPCLGLNLGAGLYRKEVFENIGPFDESLRISDDIDWFMRARERGVVLSFIDPVTLLYRRHDSNMTLARGATHAELARALKLSLDRRRRNGKAESLKNLIPAGLVSI